MAAELGGDGDAEAGVDGALSALTLISGPSGGGKSRWAEHLAARSERKVVYLATGPLLCDDEDWQRRLERHRRRRPPSWGCLEVGCELPQALERLGGGEIGLVDSLGTWVAGCLEEESAAWQERCAELERALRDCAAPLLLVVEEVGWGVVPASVAGCRFRDRLTRLQRHLGGLAGASWLVVQGRAIDLQRLGLPVPPD